MRKIGCVCILLAIFAAESASAQESTANLRDELDKIREMQNLILKEIIEIKASLSKASPPQMPQVDIRNKMIELNKDLAIKGSDGAKIVLINFTDYQCSFCGRFSRETLPQIVKNYVDTGKIRYAVVDFPLPIHEQAFKAAEASRCAKEQGHYWDISELMMFKQQKLNDLSGFGKDIGLDINKFEDCLSTSKYATAIKNDMSIAAKIGVNGVPGFIIALADSVNALEFKGFSIINGAKPYEIFQKELDSAIAMASSSKLIN
jgi:protein-disulfide isomerase